MPIKLLTTSYSTTINPFLPSSMALHGNPAGTIGCDWQGIPVNIFTWAVSCSESMHGSLPRNWTSSGMPRARTAGSMHAVTVCKFLQPGHSYTPIGCSAHFWMTLARIIPIARSILQSSDSRAAHSPLHNCSKAASVLSPTRRAHLNMHLGSEHVTRAAQQQWPPMGSCNNTGRGSAP